MRKIALPSCLCLILLFASRFYLLDPVPKSRSQWQDSRSWERESVPAMGIENDTHTHSSTASPRVRHKDQYVLTHKPFRLAFPEASKPQKNTPCNMSKCFDTARCNHLTVYIYPCDEPGYCFPLFNYLRLGDEFPAPSSEETWRVTDNPKEACVLISMSSAKPSSVDGLLAYQNELSYRESFQAAGARGLNHVFICLNDWGTRSRFPAWIQAWSAASYYIGFPIKEDKAYFDKRQFHRNTKLGFDIAFPLLPHSITHASWCNGTGASAGLAYCVSFSVKERDKHRERPILAYFRGQKTSTIRRLVYKLHDPNRSIIAEDTQKKKSLMPFVEAMTKTRFVLAPDGVSYGQTYRMIEGMSAGAVPVYIGQVMVPPFSEILPFHEYAVDHRVRRPTESLQRLKERLEALVTGCDGNGGCEWERLQANSIWVYEHYFATTARAIAGLLEVFARRFRGSNTTIRTVNGYFKTHPNFCSKMARLEADLAERGHPPPPPMARMYSL